MALVPVDYPLASLDVVLEDFHTPTPVVRSDGYPFRLVNMQGQPGRCMPTPVSYPRSRAFKQSPTTGQRGPGVVYNTITKEWEEPNIREREELMGMRQGDSEGLGVSYMESVARVGQAMDHNVMRWLGAIMGALWFP